MFWKRRTTDDFAAEVRAHLEIETDRLIAEGLTPEDARAAAHRRFGNATRVRERFYETTRWAWLDQARLDVRSAARSVARYPLAALVAVVSLGGGIGAATATLTLRDTLFYNPPPLYAQPQQLSVIRVSTPDRARASVPAPLFRLWSEDPSIARAMAAAAPARPAEVRLVDRTETIAVRPVTSELFRLLGVSPILGRSFSSEAAAGPPQAVLHHRIWQTVFGGRPEVVGETIWIDGAAHTVIGVLPEHFWYSVLNEPIWTVVDLPTLTPDIALDVVVRRDATMSPGALQASLQAMTAKYMETLPVLRDTGRTARGVEGRVQVLAMAGTPIGEAMGPVPLFLIGGAVLLTVLIACTNVAILMIAQWTAREHEIAIRASIGASRWRIIRALVTESVLIALTGGVLGMAVAFAIRGLIIRNAGELTAFDLSIHPDVLLGTAVITMMAGVLTGLVPALHETRRCEANPLTRLRTSDRVRQRWRHALVAFEIAVTVALLVVVGTLVSATQRTLNADLGFQTAPLALARVHNPRGVDVEGIVRHLSGLAGVRSVAASLSLPMGMTGPVQEVSGDGLGPGNVRAERAEVGAGVFATLGVPLRAGRDFGDDERVAGSRVVLVSEVLASQLWPGAGAVGRTLWIDGQSHEVIGVVAAYANRSLQRPTARFYLPLAPGRRTQMQFVVRAQGQPALLLETLRKEAAALSVGNVVTNVITVEQIMTIGGKEILATAVPLAPLIGIAMLLTAAGIYGVLAFAVVRRSNELAVRVAVGAGRGDLLRLVALHSLRVVAIGMLFGVGTTFGLTRLAQGAGGIFDSPGWGAFLVPMMIVLVVGALASWIPARRAMRVDPVQLLRST